jgi:hypothetical protein
MTCKEVLARLDAYVAGDLGEDEYEKIENHLNECKACVNELFELQTMVDYLCELAKDEVKDVPESLHQTLRDIPLKHKQQKNNYKIWGIAVAALFCIVALMAVNPLKLKLTNEIADSDMALEMEMPKMSAEKNMLNMAEDEMVAEEEAENLEKKRYSDSLPAEISIRVTGDTLTATQLIMEKMDRLSIETREIEVGTIEIVNMDENKAELMIEQLEMVGRIVNQTETPLGSTLIIYIISE